ncbi:MAG: hypothetical protein IIZ38_18995 [Sphingomonas sp.]|uniref:hypothetical protein n=1 Tax=Sphingomonas sp. TaxID=28214 RepID=UPI0025DB6DE4|nr:hypothetical protein [Sphingomonas sp.]MBQ1500398.1 hypothetical protein [Sphingomonas sp.]MBQ8102659.1 hypothetical protein [Afipia sp.]
MSDEALHGPANDTGDIGLFLGAGASYDLGMPLVWELTREIKAWLTGDKLRELNAGWAPQGGGHPAHVIEDVAHVLENPDLHYELILGYLETQFLRRGPNAADYHSLYSWLVSLVSHLLYTRHILNRQLIAKQLPRYEGIRALAELHRPLRIFSLNHDVLVETIAGQFGIPIHCGFSADTIKLPRRDPTGRKIGEIEAETLSAALLAEGFLPFPNPGDFGIHLLKIHGALDQFTFNDGKDLLRLVAAPGASDTPIDLLQAANEDLLFVQPGSPNGRVNTMNEIAYADEQGVMQFLRRTLLAGAYKFDPRQAQVLPRGLLKAFGEQINFVSTLVCIGYGFGDQHINAIIRRWLEFSAKRQLQIVNPGIAETPDGFRHLVRQVTLIGSDATDYFDVQGGIERSPVERLEKKYFAAARKAGRERVGDALRAVEARSRDETGRQLAARIADLSRSGALEGIDDPGSIARRLTDEISPTLEKQLEALLNELESRGN